MKEYYFYLDSTPTHSYMKYLYKYPQAAYPYDDLVQTNQRRGRSDFEYELLDTGVFNEDRYFDVFVEYAKGAPEDILIQITVNNRGPETATLHVLPTLWFRNTWSWGGEGTAAGADADGGRGARGLVIPRSASTRCSPAARPNGCSPKTRPTPIGFSACRIRRPT